MKRVITILLLTLLLCSTSFPVFALPTNEITVEIPVTMKAQFSFFDQTYTIDQQIWYYSTNNDYITPLVSGNLYYHSFSNLWYTPAGSNPIGGSLKQLTYSVALPGSGDVVIALPSSGIAISKPEYNMAGTRGINILLNGGSVSFVHLYSETVSSQLYGIDAIFTDTEVEGNVYNVDLRAYDYGVGSIGISYYRITGLDIGDVLEIKVGNNGMYNFVDSSDTSIGYGLPFGVFVSNYEGFDPFGSWTDPDAPFDENVDNISSTLDYVIDSTTSIYDRIFFTGFADYQLNNLIVSSDLDFVEEAEVFNSTLDDIITDMNTRAANVNGYRASLSKFSDEFVKALQKADTPEQGAYITAVYQAKQQQLTNNALINSTHAVQRVISQEELDTVTELDRLEESMFSELSLQKLEDTVYYNQWFNLLNSAEAMTYRTIFDFFINGAAWAYWIVVPMTFLIVSALLGTSIRVLSRPSSGGSRDPVSMAQISLTSYDSYDSRSREGKQLHF